MFSYAAGGRGTADRYRCVWGSTRSVPATLALPRSWVCAFPIYTAQAPGCYIGIGPLVACSSSFWVLHKSTDRVGHVFVPSSARAAQEARSLMSALSPGAVRLIPSVVPASVSTRAGPVCLVSVLGSWSLATTLPVDVNHPESQEVFGYKLEGCLQFGRGCHLWV